MRHKSSGFEGLGGPCEKVSISAITRESEDRGAVGVNDTSGSVEQLEAKCLGSFELV
jgi:hypothetical protein